MAMKVKIVFIAVFLFFYAAFLIQPVYSQTMTGRLKEKLVMVRNNTDNTWQNSTLERYAYDGKGRKINYSEYTWDQQGLKWDLWIDESYKYNYKNEVVYTEHINYNRQSGKISSDHIYSYQNDLPIYEKNTMNDADGNVDFITTDTRSFNDQGNAVHTLREYSSPGKNESEISESFQTYDDNGCLTGTRTETQSDYNNNRSYSWDSIGYLVKADCNRERVSYFHKNSEYSAIVLTHSEIYKLTYDGNGYLVKKKFYSGPAADTVNESNLRSTFTYVNDSLGRPLVTVRKDEDSGILYRFLGEYDGAGHQTLQEIQQSDTSEIFWFTVVKFIYTYDEYGDLVYYYGLEGYNATTGGFDINWDNTWIYNEKHFLEKELSHDWSWDWQSGQPLNITYTTLYTDRCDGNPAYAEYYRQEGDSGPQELTTKALYSYFDLANCETPPDQRESIVLFPNPASNYLNIYSEKPFGHTEILITDERGRKIFAGAVQFNNYFSVDLRGIRPGLYFVRIKNESIDTVRKIMIKSRDNYGY
jgi:hypothetical protein